MTTWEYIVEVGVDTTAYLSSGKLSTHKLEEHLNGQGKKGWELVTFIYGNPDEETPDLFIFKHPK